MKRFLNLTRDQRGAAMIELAFIAPVIALMTVGVVDLSNGFGTKLRVEQAAQRSIEKVMTTADVVVTHRLECDNVVTADPDCLATQKESRWIQVKVAIDYAPMFPLHFTGIDSNGKYHIESVAGMRTQ